MSKYSDFSIHYDNDENMYCPGQTVTGRVALELIKPMKIKGVLLSISGKANIHWIGVKDKASGKKAKAKTTTDTERYFKHKMVLSEDNVSSHKGKMLPGSHYFTFSFLLPLNCKSSFESDNCFIRYRCKATLQAGGRSSNAVKRPFGVVSVVDLNLLPDVTSPKQVSKQILKEKDGGSIVCELYLPRGGYVPLAIIPFVFKINNSNGTKINSVIVKVMQNLILGEKESEKYICHDEVARMERIDVAFNSECIWENEVLRVPDFVPSKHRTIVPSMSSRILDLSYSLELEVVPLSTPIHAGDRTLKIPFTIGNVPLEAAAAGSAGT